MKINLSITLLLLLYAATGKTQPGNLRYYFVTKSDTVFCEHISYSTTPKGYLDELLYTDLNGTKIVLKGRKNIPDVLTFHLEDITLDKIPLKANKPKGDMQYAERRVDGKLKVYLSQQRNSNTSPASTPVKGNGASAKEADQFFLKLPNGSFYNINSKKDRDKIIKPYLLACNEFKNNYTGNYSSKKADFEEMIKIYNSLCK